MCQGGWAIAFTGTGALKLTPAAEAGRSPAPDVGSGASLPLHAIALSDSAVSRESPTTDDQPGAHHR
ncbi:hypothetical protein ACFFL2_07310 [Devosia nitrariae]